MSPALRDNNNQQQSSAAVSDKKESKLNLNFLKKKKDDKENADKEPEAAPKVPFQTLFRYAEPFDYLLMGTGAFCACLTGLSQPVMSLVFGDIMQTLVSYPFTKDDNALRTDVVKGVVYLTIIGVVVGLSAWAQMALWIWSGERQAKKIREEYLEAVLRQDMAFFDRTQTGEITTRMTGDIVVIQEGISDKVAMVFQSLSAFLAGFIIAFAKGWRLALVLSCAFPLLGGAATLMGKSLAARKSGGADAYAEAGAIAQEVLSSLRTVTSFGGQKRELARYSEKLKRAEWMGIRGAVANGLATGVAFMIIFATYSLGFWYGGQLIPEHMTSGQVVTVFFSIIIGAFSLGLLGPSLASISAATGVAGKIFETIDRVSPINPFSTEGLKPDVCTGEVVFDNVSFHYPQRTDVPILKSFSLRVPAGKTVALVGASGSGKSTIVKLLERYYDSVSGTITVDGVNVRDLNVQWLRKQIGIVSQEPVLFDRTVRENLLIGMQEDHPESHFSKGVLDAKIENACRVANAWDFIQALPNGLDTSVGEAGGMMSGGQKQRIAIARSIMREPKVLLLDEATSALDTASERVVQAALDSAAENRTTIVIAHRLSTIRNADLIVVMGAGEIIEQGTHNELLAKNGAYANLVSAQALREAEEEQGAAAQTEKAVIASSSAKQVSAGGEFIITDFGMRKEGDSVAIELGPLSPTSPTGATNLLAAAQARREKKKAEEEEKKKAEKERLKRGLPLLRLYGMNGGEWWLLLLGSIMSAGNGIVFPMFSLIFSEIINVFGNPNDGERNDGIRFWSIMFVIISCGSFVVNAVSIICFGTAGERLTRKLREKSFEALLRQEIAYFDDEKHSTGIITGQLSEDAFQVQGLVGQSMATIVQLSASIAAGLILAFTNGWQLTLVVLGTMPLMGAAGQLQMSMMTGFGSKTKEAYEDASNIANEAIDQIRTVMTLTKEKMFLDIYKANIKEPHAIAIKGGLVAAVGFALGQGIIFLTYALAFYAGSQFTIMGIMDAPSVLKVMFAVIFTAISLGQASALAPNYVKAKLAALSIFDLLDRTSRINPASGEGVVMAASDVQGIAEVKDGVFNYPARPDVPVLQGMSIKALPGQTVALVGPSGCGKSTMIGILERWYDLHNGEAHFDNQNLKNWNLANLRSHIALVGQEPVLFNYSIRENIAYGAINGIASEEEIETAARKANIHDFVKSLPEGYNTVVGSKGGQLSGGQKQRVAIARALIREPKLLLLDEATSALDSESEKVVQAALDVAAEGRTTIVIAHRLSTIQNADHIIVAKGGRVIEQGTYDNLLKANGQFAELVAAQSLAKQDA
ncbi:P-loop containing nucleoside triphosphate hydrolase protein [Obelidium mucronatum]|nr:P-loop containing nucleoside triphosphate hydrolase protein [Obelidium mucronatum]